MSKIGYIRVSTEHQETARQQEIMCSYQVDRIFSEKLSGANTDRPQLRAMLDYVREGDTLYIESISRLGRSTKDLLNIIDTLTEKGVTLISHKESIDTDTPKAKAPAEPVQSTADKVPTLNEIFDRYERQNAHFTRESHRHLSEIARRRQRNEQERIIQTEERERKNRP